MDFSNQPRLVHLMIQLSVSLGWMWGTIQEHKIRVVFQWSKLILQMKMAQSQEEKIKVMQMRNQLFEQWQVTEEQMGLQEFKDQDKSYSNSLTSAQQWRLKNIRYSPVLGEDSCAVWQWIYQIGERYNIWYSENSLTVWKLLIVFITTKCGGFLKGYVYQVT